MNISINKVSPHEIDRVLEILSNVVTHMHSVGFTQWDDKYPTKEILSRDIVCDCLYGIYEDGYLFGFAALNTHQSEEYEEINWQFSEPCLVVHRLQIDPEYRGKKAAYKLMLFAEELALKQKLNSIRLDTREDNIPANSLYKKLGYIKRGHVHFPRMKEYEFPCYEKEINKE